MPSFLVSTAVALMVVTYGLDVLGVAVGGAKVPLALLLMFISAAGFAWRAAILGRVSGSLLAGALLWVLCVVAVLISTLSGDQNIGEHDIRLVLYSFALVPFLALGREEKMGEVGLGLLLGIALLVFVGFYRFLFVVGGDPIQHLFGYWGIKYLPSTRNGDVFYPLVGTAVALHFVSRGAIGMRIVMFALTALFCVAVTLSSSRAAWITMVTMLLLYGLRPSTRSLPFLVVTCMSAVTVVGGVLLAVPELAELVMRRAESLFSLEAGAGGSNFERFQLLQAAGATLLERPMGVGVGYFGPEVRYINESGDFLNHAENLLVTVAVEQGILGVAIYGALILALLRRAWVASTPGANIGFVIVVHGLFNYEINSLFFWMILGYAIGSGELGGVDTGVRRRATHSSRVGIDTLAGQETGSGSRS